MFQDFLEKQIFPDQKTRKNFTEKYYFYQIPIFFQILIIINIY